MTTKKGCYNYHEFTNPNLYKTVGSWNLTPSEKRLLEKDNRKILQAEIQRLIDEPLNKPLPAKDKARIAERVKSGRKGLSRIGLGL